MNKWEWFVDFNHLNQIYTARLMAYRLSNYEYKAEMYISLSGGFNEYKWFEGTIIYGSHSCSKDWENDSEDIKYNFVKIGR